MRISVAEAETQLAQLVRMAEDGEEVVLTRDGREAARIVPPAQSAAPAAVRDPEAFRAMIRELQDSVAAKVKPGTDAARSQDFLYDENGLPG